MSVNFGTHSIYKWGSGSTLSFMNGEGSQGHIASPEAAVLFGEYLLPERAVLCEICFKGAVTGRVL